MPAASSRIHILDALRGVAVLGILLMNIPFFAMPELTAMNLNIRQEYGGWNYYVWWIVELFFHGAMRGMFSLLFGASMVLLTSKDSMQSSGLDAADVYYRRLLWLFLFGLIHGFLLLWPGDILYAYAICGMFLYPFRLMSPRLLAIMATVLLVLLTLKITWTENEPLHLRQRAQAVLARDTSIQKRTAEEKETLEKWQAFQDKENLENQQKSVEEELTKLKGSFSDTFSYLAGITVILQTEWFYHVQFLDCFIFMLFGIALFKIGILTGQKSRGFYAGMATVGYLISLPMGYYELATKVESRFDAVAFLESMPFQWYEIKRLALTLGHTGLILWIHRSGWLRRVFDWLSAVGKMAFTHYIMQTLLCGALFYGFAGNLLNELERYEMYLVCVGIWVLQLLFSQVWLRYFRIGPLEWVWRSATYWHRQPLRK